MRLLWEVCQIPDFRKVMSDSHTRLLAHIFLHLTGPEERLPTDWIAAQIAALDRTDGDIDSLMTRIAHIRTWTYITHRSDWVAGASIWQERARAIEDRLSDALHDLITQRFVDRRSAFLIRQLALAGELMAAVAKSGEVLVEGAPIGRLEGLRFVAQPFEGVEMRLLIAAASRPLRAEIAARARMLAADADEAFAIGAAGELYWRGEQVGRMTAGEALLSPKAEALGGDFIDGDVRDRVRRRLQAFLRGEIERRLMPLFALRDQPLGGAGRGLVHQLVDALGCLPAVEAGRQAASLGRPERAALARLGVRFGVESIYFEPSLRREAVRFRALLWAVHNGRPTPPLPAARAMARPTAIDPALPQSFYAAIGLRAIDGIALRPDRLERIAAAVRRRARQGPFTADAELASAAGLDPEELRLLVSALGYRALIDANGETFAARRRRRGLDPNRRRRHAAPEGHPFAKLRELKLA